MLFFKLKYCILLTLFEELSRCITFIFFRWEYKTEEHDIGFGLFRKNGDDWEEVLPIERKDCSVITLDGSYKCKDPGTCKSIFDKKLKKKFLHYQ